MFEEVMFLATRSYGGLASDFSGGVIGDFLNSAAEAGLFAYLLPFLLIFAIVFGILQTSNIFKDNKAVNGIIALVVGLMALQFELVPLVFQDIFPRLGVGLGILIVILILVGVFIPHHVSMTWTLLGVSTIIAIIVLVQTGDSLGFQTGSWWTDNWPAVAVIVFVLILVAIIMGNSGERKPKGDIMSTFMKNLMSAK